MTGFSDCCKAEKMEPLLSKGSKTKASNYNPLKSLPLISKFIKKKTIHENTQSSIKISKELLKESLNKNFT